MRLLTLALSAALAAFPQARDFLTADEVDRVRATAEDPNERLLLYTELARLRVDMVESLLADSKPGRSALIHRALEDYARIIETMDIVTDDALKRGKDVTLAVEAVAKAEEDLLTRLKKIDDDAPKDIERYQFVLTSAIDATSDSLEFAKEDLAERKTQVAAREAADKKEREALMTPGDLKERKAAEAKKAEVESKQKRKAPTLRRKGETAPPR